jgi:hypothetical protein
MGKAQRGLLTDKQLRKKAQKRHKVKKHALLKSEPKTRDAFDIQRMMGHKLVRMCKEMKNPTVEDIKRATKEIEAKTDEFCKFMGI